MSERDPQGRQQRNNDTTDNQYASLLNLVRPTETSQFPQDEGNQADGVPDISAFLPGQPDSHGASFDIDGSGEIPVYQRIDGESMVIAEVPRSDGWRARTIARLYTHAWPIGRRAAGHIAQALRRSSVWHDLEVARHNAIQDVRTRKEQAMERERQATEREAKRKMEEVIRLAQEARVRHEKEAEMKRIQIKINQSMKERETATSFFRRLLHKVPRYPFSSNSDETLHDIVDRWATDGATGPASVVYRCPVQYASSDDYRDKFVPLVTKRRDNRTGSLVYRIAYKTFVPDAIGDKSLFARALMDALEGKGISVSPDRYREFEDYLGEILLLPTYSEQTQNNRCGISDGKNIIYSTQDESYNLLVAEDKLIGRLELGEGFYLRVLLVQFQRILNWSPPDQDRRYFVDIVFDDEAVQQRWEKRNSKVRELLTSPQEQCTEASWYLCYFEDINRGGVLDKIGGLIERFIALHPDVYDHQTRWTKAFLKALKTIGNKPFDDAYWPKDDDGRYKPVVGKFSDEKRQSLCCEPDNDGLLTLSVIPTPDRNDPRYIFVQGD